MKRITLTLAAAIALSATLTGCSTTHEARIPTSCDIPSLKKLLPVFDLDFKDQPGSDTSLACSTVPMATILISQDLIDSKVKNETLVQYQTGGTATIDAKVIAQEKKNFSRVEVTKTNGCTLLTAQNPKAPLVSAVAYCNGFTIYVHTPKSWADAVKIASAAIVGLIQ